MNQVNMGILQDVFNALQTFELTKIDGQPTDEDINKLTTQLTHALVTILTGNGGGKLGHIGIVVPETQYVTLSMGHKLNRPIYPGPYPATASDDKKTREKEVAEHNAEVIEFETYMACKAWARQAIVKAVDEEWIPEKHDEDIGYQAVEPLELLKLLRSAGGDLDNLEITELNTKMLEPWDGVEAPVTMFARADKYKRQLERHIIPNQPKLPYRTQSQLTRPAGSLTLQCKNGTRGFQPTKPSPSSACTSKTNTRSKSNGTGRPPDPSKRESQTPRPKMESQALKHRP